MKMGNEKKCVEVEMERNHEKDLKKLSREV